MAYLLGVIRERIMTWEEQQLDTIPINDLLFLYLSNTLTRFHY